MSQNKVVAFGDSLSFGLYYLHSAFRDVDNFVNLNNELVSVSEKDQFLSPSSLIISGFRTGTLSKVLIQSDSIILNSRAHALNTNLVYKSCFSYPRDIGMDEIRIKISAFLQRYAALFPERSLIFLLSQNCRQEQSSVFDAAFKNHMIDAFAYFQSDLLKCVNKMKWRGYGLTPSGDDFIAGVLFGLNMLSFYNNKDFKNISTAIFQSAVSKNIYSNNMLRWAYYGKYFKRLKDFIAVLLTCSLPEVKPVFEALISVGATSGADILCGFMSVILKRPLLLECHS